jgi:thiol-disulfide isomerase/thioredoxin
MKRILTTLAALTLAVAVFAQEELPTTAIKDVKTNKKVAFNQTIESGKITVISFWATWCVPCKKEIKSFREKLPEWQKETEFNYMTISLDETRAEGLVRSYAKSQGWDFPYYMDPNSDLQRALNFQNVPFTLVIDQNGKVAYEHTGYAIGNENEIYEKVKELAAKK